MRDAFIFIDKISKKVLTNQKRCDILIKSSVEDMEA